TLATGRVATHQRRTMTTLRLWRLPRVPAAIPGLIVYTMFASSCARGPLASVFNSETTEDRIARREREDSEDREEREEELARMIERSRMAVPAAPTLVKPRNNASAAVWRNALRAR